MELYIFRFHFNFSFSNFAICLCHFLQLLLCKTICVDLIEVKFMIHGDEFTYVHYCRCHICVVPQLIHASMLIQSQLSPRIILLVQKVWKPFLEMVMCCYFLCFRRLFSESLIVWFPGICFCHFPWLDYGHKVVFGHK